MTPKQRAEAALNRRCPDDIVPTMEIEFQLHKALVGRDLILGEEFGELSGKDREKAIRYNVEIYAEEAELLDYSSITIDPLYWQFGHGVGTKFYYPTLEDQIDMAKALYKEIGDRVFLAVSMDSTYGIPLAEEMQQFIFDMYDRPDELLENAKNNLSKTVENAKRLIDAGVGVIYSCSDYCFGTSPFYSIDMFEKFIYPFLKEQTRAFRDGGAYVIKHTDGNISQIIDMMVDCQPHAIHSIDPMAGMDIAKIKKDYGDKICIMGNVDVSKIEMGEVDEIKKSAMYALEHAKEGGGYIYSTCNTVFESVPLEYYQLMLDIRKQYGRYDD